MKHSSRLPVFKTMPCIYLRERPSLSLWTREREGERAVPRAHACVQGRPGASGKEQRDSKREGGGPLGAPREAWVPPPCHGSWDCPGDVRRTRPSLWDAFCLPRNVFGESHTSFPPRNLPVSVSAGPSPAAEHTLGHGGGRQFCASFLKRVSIWIGSFRVQGQLNTRCTAGLGP